MPSPRTGRCRGTAVLATVLGILLAGAVAVPAPARAADGCDDTVTPSGNAGPNTGVYPGPRASDRYDELFVRGHSVPHLRTRVPQGMATWSNWKGDDDLLLITSYAPGPGDAPFHPTKKAYIIALDARTGRHVGTAGVDPSHVGGIAVFEEQGWAFVSDDRADRVRRYPLDRLREAVERNTPEEVAPDTAPEQPVVASSFLTSHAPTDTLWAGEFTDAGPASMRSYLVAADGTLAPTFSTTPVPARTQGAVVTDDAFVFSSSNGRNARSSITVVRRDRDQSFCFAAPSMTEAAAVHGDDVHLLFESGAAEYSEAADAPDNIIDNLHQAPLADLLRARP